jgi:hypothetical protein
MAPTKVFRSSVRTTVNPRSVPRDLAHAQFLSKVLLEVNCHKMFRNYKTGNHIVESYDKRLGLCQDNLMSKHRQHPEKNNITARLHDAGLKCRELTGVDFAAKDLQSVDTFGEFRKY